LIFNGGEVKSEEIHSFPYIPPYRLFVIRLVIEKSREDRASSALLSQAVSSEAATGEDTMQK